MHNLNFGEQLGRYAFATVREKAWHGLGVIVDNPMTAEEAIVQGGIDYTVEKHPMYVYPNAAEPMSGKKVPDYFSTVRMDEYKPLGVVGSAYSVLQNRDAFRFFDVLVSAGEAMYETVGALGRGERIFITAKLPQTVQVANDLIDLYVFLTHDHTGNRGVRVAFTPTRIVCNNTLNMAMLNAKHMISVRHVGDMSDAMKKAAEIMEKLAGMKERLVEVGERMALRKLTTSELYDLVMKVMVPQTEQLVSNGLSARSAVLVNDVIDYTLTHPTQQGDGVHMTMWGFVNGITGYHQNVVEKKNRKALLDYTLEGLGAKRNAKAWKLAEDAVLRP
jgi:phage/plasmid-like protein (TIGR03299 family)